VSRACCILKAHLEVVFGVHTKVVDAMLNCTRIEGHDVLDLSTTHVEAYKAYVSVGAVEIQRQRLPSQQH
jgi:hypothetical protein